MTTTVLDRYMERSASDRLHRAMLTLKFTGQNTTVPWLRGLCHRKWWEAASAQKLRSCGYHISLRTTRDWRVF